MEIDAIDESSPSASGMPKRAATIEDFPAPLRPTFPNFASLQSQMLNVSKLLIHLAKTSKERPGFKP